MSQQPINSEAAEQSTDDQSLLPVGAVSLSPTAEFLLLFGLTLVAALSLALIF